MGAESSRRQRPWMVGSKTVSSSENAVAQEPSLSASMPLF